MKADEPVARVGCDALALKPTECEVSAAVGRGMDTIAIDYEGREHLPERDTLSALSEHATVYLTTPVRADGFDPSGEGELIDWIPDGIGRILVAGHPAYLSDTERSRSVAPRLRAALDSIDSEPEPWVGTENIERLALAAGGVQYDLLSHTTLREIRALRSIGYDGTFAVYAPTVLSDSDDVILDAVGAYVARRSEIQRQLSEIDTTEDAYDHRASGAVRDILLTGVQEFTLSGDVETVREQIGSLRTAGVDSIVSYPANGLSHFKSVR